MRPCGGCLGCRLDYSLQWALRCVHESQLHDQNCFITLTYNSACLPSDESIHKEDLQNFFKRLRKYLQYPGPLPLFDKAMRIQYYRSKAKKFVYRYGQPKLMDSHYDLSYYACGEYGEKLGRPHYHAIIFGYEFSDKVLLSKGRVRYFKGHFKKSESDDLYTSETLEKIWGKGFVTIGEVTFESAAYVARYCMKKIYGKDSAAHYCGKIPEFALMSKGLGKKWFLKYKTDIYPKDYTTLNGRRYKGSRYYDKLLEKSNPEMLEEIKKIRQERSEKVVREENKKGKFAYADRLKGKFKYKKEITKILERDYEK